MSARHSYPFEKLRVWDGARKVVRDVYGVTKGFPHSEVCGLISQINRAAVSVAANLAEGSARASRKDQAHFSRLAYSSLMELACLLILGLDLGFALPEDESRLREAIEALPRQINALRNKQLC